MMFDDDDDMPLPDQFLSQLDMIESQAMATMDTNFRRNENEDPVVLPSGPVLAEVANLKHTIEDYKRQIETLQDREISLQGEATMLRQRLDAKQKEADTVRMEMNKSIDQISQANKKKIEELEHQVRNYRSQVQFTTHERKANRNSLEGSFMASQSQRMPPRDQFSGGTQGRQSYDRIHDEIPGLKAESALKIADENISETRKSVSVDRKWFLNPSKKPQTYAVPTRNVSVSCPVSKQPFTCDLSSESAAKSVIRMLNQHVKAVLSNETECKSSSEQLVLFFDLISTLLISLDQPSDAENEEDRQLSIVTLLEQLCSFFEDGAVLRQILSKINMHCAALRLVASMFVKLPVKRQTAEPEKMEGMDSSSNTVESRWQAALQLTFEKVLPSLLIQNALENVSPVSKSNGNTFSELFEAGLFAIAAASSSFNVIDLRSQLQDCPLLTIATAFQQWFAGFPLDARIKTLQRRTCFTFVQLITRTITLSSSAIERFFNHPCHCQPIVIGVLAHIGLASMKANFSKEESLKMTIEINQDLLNALVLDATVNALLLVESQQPLKSTNHQAVFYLFLAKLAEFLALVQQPQIRESSAAAIRQLVRLHDVSLS